MSETVIDERSSHQRVDSHPSDEAPRRTGKHAATNRSHVPLSLIALSAALGVLAVAAVYTAGRHGYASSAWADGVYWLGQALIVVPVAIRLLRRHVLTTREVVLLITVLSVAEYFVTVCYSPTSFTFADELAHWRTSVNILQTGKLFTANYQLPISPHYPGLEEATSALVSVTGLPIFESGLIIAGVAHILFVYVLYIFFRRITRSYRVASVAILCYASSPHFVSFDSMFIYQTLALPFLGLTLLAVWHLSSVRETGAHASWLFLALLMSAATVVTHHVTSYVLVAALVIISLSALFIGKRPMAARTGLVALLSAAAAVAWMRFTAAGTLTYLRPFADETVQGLRALVAGGQTRAPPTSAGPLGDQALSAATVLTISVLLPIGWWRIWRSHRNQPWPVAMAIVAASWYVIVAARLAVADGSELAGRAATFVYVPVAYTVALAVGYLAGLAPRNLADSSWRWQKRAVAVAALTVMPVLIFDGLANGWPPYWERLPGPYLVAGSERSVGPEEIATARWVLAALGPGNRFAADAGNSPVLGTYGDQNPVLADGFLYTSAAYTPSDIAQVQALAIHYVLVDLRLATSLPASGQYFPVDPNADRYAHPLPLRDLTKFNQAPGVQRIYDDGNIVVYNLAGEGGVDAP